MPCPNCMAPHSDDSIFCSKCGYRVRPEATPTLSERITKLEQQLAADSVSGSVEQRTLELETAENVMNRVKGWTTLILYFAGIPAAAALLLLAVAFGKGSFDMYKIAANAKESVGAVLEQAQTTAKQTKQSVDDASSKSKQINQEIDRTREAVGKLRDQVDTRTQEVQSLGARIKDSETQVTALKNELGAQSERLHALRDEVKVVKTSRNANEVVNAYPALGDHFVGGKQGWIDPEQKEDPTLTYALLSLLLTRNTPVNREQMAEAMTLLQENKDKVFLDFISVYAGSRTTSNQGVGTPLNANGCGLYAIPPTKAPCILYFNEGSKVAAIKARDLMKSIQLIPDQKIVFVNPKDLAADKQELLRMSHIDIAVILGMEP